MASFNDTSAIPLGIAQTAIAAATAGIVLLAALHAILKQSQLLLVNAHMYSRKRLFE